MDFSPPYLKDLKARGIEVGNWEDHKSVYRNFERYPKLADNSICLKLYLAGHFVLGDKDLARAHLPHDRIQMCIYVVGVGKTQM